METRWKKSYILSYVSMYNLLSAGDWPPTLPARSNTPCRCWRSGELARSESWTFKAHPWLPAPSRAASAVQCTSAFAAPSAMAAVHLSRRAAEDAR